MVIIKDRVVSADHWLHVPEPDKRDAKEALPTGDIIVPLACWQSERESLKGRRGGLGVRLQASDDVEGVAEELRDVNLIALTFAAFTDGRPFSQARLLRGKYEYKGEIRATGHFLLDQLFFMERCGINAFEVNDEQEGQRVLRAFSEISVCYQPSGDGPGLSERLFR